MAAVTAETAERCQRSIMRPMLNVAEGRQNKAIRP